jgi:6-phosphofructokinase 2
MIVTLTMNPALDITTIAPQVRPTDKIRCGPARYDAGGRGIIVARFAQALGESASAVFPAGGPTGGLITELVSRAGVRCHRIPIDESIRESFTVNDEGPVRRRTHRCALACLALHWATVIIEPAGTRRGADAT